MGDQQASLYGNTGKWVAPSSLHQDNNQQQDATAPAFEDLDDNQQQEDDDVKGDDEKEEELNIPDSFMCPICDEVMLDPVICAGDEQTYERSEITEWFSRSKRSPMTNQELAITTLVSNFALKSAIQEF